MAYQLTSATTVEDLVNKIADFAATAGWTVRRNTLVTTSRTVTIQKGGDNIHIWNTVTSAVRVRASVGYDVALAANAQPNQAVSEGQCNTGVGPFSNVFLFAGNAPTEYLHVVVEISSGIFRHMHFGELRKIGAYTGGTFFEAMYYNGTNTNYNDSPFSTYHHISFSSRSEDAGSRGGVRCDVDGNANYFAPFERAASYATPTASGLGALAGGSTGDDYRSRFYDAFFLRSVNSWSGVTPLKPIKIRVERGANYYSEIGEVPGIRSILMSRFQPGDEFTIGSDVWKVFPWVRQGMVTDQQYSYDYAFAYLKA